MAERDELLSRADAVIERRRPADLRAPERGELVLPTGSFVGAVRARRQRAANAQNEFNEAEYGRRRQAARNGITMLQQAAQADEATGANMLDALSAPLAEVFGVAPEDIAEHYYQARQNPGYLEALAGTLQQEDEEADRLHGANLVFRRPDGTYAVRSQFRSGRAQETNLDGTPMTMEALLLREEGQNERLDTRLSAQRELQGERLALQTYLNEPQTLFDQARARAEGTAAGESASTLESSLQSIGLARQTIGRIIEAPPALLQSVLGTPSIRGIFQGGAGMFGAIPGTPAADVAADIEQAFDQARQEAYEALKGGGHITEAESMFGANARTSLRRARTYSEFMAEARRFQQRLDDAEAILNRRANRPGPTGRARDDAAPNAPAPNAPARGGAVEGRSRNDSIDEIRRRVGR